MSARVLAQHQARARDPHLFRADDLVREPVLQHAVLVDPRFVGEGVAADHGLVGLGKDTDHVGQELARPEQDRKSTRLNSSHGYISYAVFCLKKKKKHKSITTQNT